MEDSKVLTPEEDKELKELQLKGIKLSLADEKRLQELLDKIAFAESKKTEL